MRRAWIAIVGLAGCPKAEPAQPEQVQRFVAEEACESTRRASPPVPARPPADPYRLSPPAAMFYVDSDHVVPVTFLCDLPDQILGIAATQTVDGGKRIVGGTVYTRQRTTTARAIPSSLPIDPQSAGCKQGETACVWKTSSPAIEALETVPAQWVNTSGWVHGMDDLCRALPDDTIAVCSTDKHMAYVELGCGPELQLGIHDTTLPRLFDLDIEVPNARLRGGPDPTNGGDRWSYSFKADKPSSATLAFDLATNTATLTIDGVREGCFAWGIYRR